MAKIEKKTKRYPSDLTDEEWTRIEPFLPRASKAGRPIEVDLREVMNAIRYMARSGGGWRMLPNDFPPWQTVYWWFRRFVRRFMFQTIHDVAMMLDRERVGREASPTGGVVDSQSVKAPEAKTRGYATRVGDGIARDSWLSAPLGNGNPLARAPQLPLHVGAGRPLRANGGRWRTACRTRQIDPKLAFRFDPGTGRLRQQRAFPWPPQAG
jgi:transposase